ncbi:MAG: phospholipid carrier-dependent glycosyltransferase [Patescibacteria group bacterium]
MLLVLTFLGLLTRFIFINQPNQTVFDEVHFGKFVSSYFTGKYYFDIHPPLGKLIIALGAWLGGYQNYIAEHGVFSFENIGQDYGALPFVWFRFFPALAGALIPIAIFLFLKELKINSLVAFFASLFMVFDNALLVQSRLILLDSFLILFGFLGLYFFFKARNKDYSSLPLAFAGLFFSLSALVKWTGLAFLGVAGVVYLFDLFKLSLKTGIVSRSRKGFLFLILIPLLVYFAVFQLHLALLPRCPEPAEGNGCDFMSQEFRNNQLNSLEKFSELNQKMWQYNTGLSASHDFGSKAIGWPLMARAVYYWVSSNSDEGVSRIYFFGNPLVWLLGLIGIVNLIFYRPEDQKDKEIKNILLLLYLANFLPFILVKRVLFLYHYLSAMIISLASFWFVVGEQFLNFKKGRFWLAVVLLLVAGSWLFYAPLSYGFPLAEKQFQSRQWFGLWFSTNSGLKNICQESNCSILNWLTY